MLRTLTAQVNHCPFNRKTEVGDLLGWTPPRQWRCWKHGEHGKTRENSIDFLWWYVVISMSEREKNLRKGKRCILEAAQSMGPDKDDAQFQKRTQNDTQNDGHATYHFGQLFLPAAHLMFLPLWEDIWRTYFLIFIGRYRNLWIRTLWEGQLSKRGCEILWNQNWYCQRYTGTVGGHRMMLLWRWSCCRRRSPPEEALWMVGGGIARLPLVLCSTVIMYSARFPQYVKHDI